MIAKKPKRRSLMTAKKSAWKAFSVYIRTRDTHDGLVVRFGHCFTCNAPKNFNDLEAGHFIPAPHEAIRFDDRNVHAQCTRCNRYLRGNLLEYFPRMEAKYGREVVDELLSRKHEVKRWKVWELEGIEAEAKRRTQELLDEDKIPV